ncbi:hypothetical protein [Lutimonas sp.]|uniref:hypothetical protein n=1 Tax=Lutimonas sp. TaxID=1872403 RepID=UPI003D9B6DBD
MKLEYSILEHLSNNDNGKLVDITFIEDDHARLRRSLNELKGKNMILLDDLSGRDFEAFGIANDRKKAIKAKIKMNGRVYFHSLKAKKSVTGSKQENKSSRSLSFFF